MLHDTEDHKALLSMAIECHQGILDNYKAMLSVMETLTDEQDSDELSTALANIYSLPSIDQLDTELINAKEGLADLVVAANRK
jgi:hypothetical protein